jgi:cbb3-type cytochrome oxidase subunit 3
MTETQGLIAGMLLFFALYLYIFWPEKAANSQRGKHLDEDPHDPNIEQPLDQGHAIHRRTLLLS